MLNFNEYKIHESIKQAKQYLSTKEIETDNNPVLARLSELLKKKPNLIGNFIKYHYEENISLEELSTFIQYMTTNKATVEKLPKDLIDYDKFEYMQDDLRVVERSVKANKLYGYLHPELRSQINQLDAAQKNDLDSLVIDFMDLPEEKRKAFTPLKFFRENKTSVSDFFERMMDFVENLDSGRERIEQMLAEHKGKYEIVYNQDDILIVKGNDRELVKAIGSEKWCIVYAQDTYYNRYLAPSTNNTHYTIFNFNYSLSNRHGRFGVTITERGKPSYGGCQDNLNTETNIEDIAKSLSVDTTVLSGILTNDYMERKTQINKLADSCTDMESFRVFHKEVSASTFIFKQEVWNAIQSMFTAKAFFPNFKELTALIDTIAVPKITKEYNYEWEDVKPYLNAEVAKYITDHDSTLFQPISAKIPQNYYLKYFYTHLVNKVLDNEYEGVIEWDNFLEMFIKVTDEEGGDINDEVTNHHEYLIKTFHDDDNFMDYLINEDISLIFENEHEYGIRYLDFPKFYAKYASKTGMEPENTLQAIIQYKEARAITLDELASHLDVEKTEEGETYIVYEEIDDLCEYYEELDTFEYDSYSEEKPNKEYIRYNIGNLKRIVNHLVGIGYEFDLAVFDELEDKDYSSSESAQLIRTNEALYKINQKVKEIVTEEYEPSESEEDNGDFDYATDLIDVIETAYSDAQRQADRDGFIDETLSRLKEFGFTSWKRGNWAKYNDGDVMLKIDLDSMLNKISDSDYEGIFDGYGDSILINELVSYISDGVGKLYVRYSDYYSIDDDVFNELLSPSLSSELNERTVFKFKNYIKLIK